jgi:hypothetical protein
MLSYRWIERPTRHNRWIEARPRGQRVAAFALLPVVACLLVGVLFDQRSRVSLSAVAQAPDDWRAKERMLLPGLGTRRCRVEIHDTQLAGGLERRYLPRDCEAAGRSLFVLGDSHATAMSPLYEQLSAEQGMAVTLRAAGGCAYIDFKLAMDDPSRSESCRVFAQASRDATAAQARPGDIVVLPSLRLERYGDQWASFDVPDMYDKIYGGAAAAQRRAALAEAGRWLQPFVDRQLRVVFVAPTPVFKAPPFRCSDWFNQHNPICVGQNRQSRAELERLRLPILDGMRSLQATLSGVAIWDAFSELCPGQTCYTQREGRPLYFDGDHLSGYGNYVVYPSFRQAVLDAGPRTQATAGASPAAAVEPGQPKPGS